MAVTFALNSSPDGIFAVSDHTCDDLREIKSAFDTVLVQTVYPEKGITFGEKINHPGEGFFRAPMIVHHADDYACNLGELITHKTCIQLPLLTFSF